MVSKGGPLSIVDLELGHVRVSEGRPISGDSRGKSIYYIYTYFQE